MKKLLAIFKWEFGKVFTDWKRTLTVFLLPALLMMLALIIFPQLINYLSTGSLGRTNIYVVNSPKSFDSYYENIEGRTAYGYTFYTKEEFEELKDSNNYQKALNKGTIVIEFSEDFDAKTKEYYETIKATHSEDLATEAQITITYADLFNVDTKVEQFISLVIDDYTNTITDYLDIDTSDVTASYIDINSFNPVGKLLYNRTIANEGASRILPPVMVLLLYYCIYALTMDSFHGDRERGFFTKLKMTPVGIKTIIWGKILSIVTISIGSSLLTFFMMFLVSWTNFSNDSMSLLPFGMFLTLGQFLLLFLNIVSLAFLFTTLSVVTVFSLRNPADVTINLQMPLVLILTELFLMFLIPGETFIIDYFLPIHGTILVIQSIFRSLESPFIQIIVLLINAGITAIAAKIIFRKEALE